MSSTWSMKGDVEFVNLDDTDVRGFGGKFGDADFRYSDRDLELNLSVKYNILYDLGLIASV